MKALRRTAEMTLQQLSERSGVSVATLSKIENGHSGASFDTVLKVARGLGVLFDNLVADEVSDRRNLSRLVVTRAGDAEEYPSEIYTYRAYGTEMLHRRLMPLMIEVKTRTVPDPVDWSTHEGEEFILVLDGEIDLHTEHYKPQRLRTGDAAYFDSLMRHAFVAVGCSAAKILSVSLADTGPHGPSSERADTVGSPLRARQTEPV